MSLTPMSPERIREVFEHHALDQRLVDHAIAVILDQLEWIPDRDAKAASPYSISRLTEGLPSRDRIIDRALRLSEERMLRANHPLLMPDKVIDPEETKRMLGEVVSQMEQLKEALKEGNSVRTNEVTQEDDLAVGERLRRSIFGPRLGLQPDI
ncbi:hypothetical protein [Methylobacterium oryzae]|uniref:hypothetical protein n=1 Tax=Methylobacterium oryzae TaxID=334852 RepID=UPI001F2F3A75|nr:hypothetical protein [Methylobacterium oryzae]UIN38400.1 hypothetical protein LXM90_30930 [Methylobacterium oryzae]